ncbi:ABC transporter ATP-binding protein [Metabacillus sediminilitoris]|uniref:ATP-binding cassette domain-containing protein n=1 Tax=Metabacillus sediminilitoris TaxID=2567941 RepID=A0A4S4BNM2_9BACI|nr:ATP-binding cassette domain-containing protein [Metabacillus sediminilitoris]QGQ45106.1 ATP-binding cassette domain-containing protein [Metabacillus sediminilitoris]THF76473.1 ATP-binding cassette domain-containing protein [Metabacillus sediminilitoris]
MQLKAHDLAFRYGKQPWIFKNINVTLEQGEIVGLIGPSGCGKTTFCRVLAGLLTPKMGIVTLNGAPISNKGYHPVQLVFQHPEKAVNPRWKMEKTLNEGWQPDAKILDALGIQREWLSRWPNELSGGELQRFCVARALGPQTRFLIADEMTTMLDAITQAQIWHAVLEIAKEREMGILVVSHEAKLMQRLCDKVIHFDQNQ